MPTVVAGVHAHGWLTSKAASSAHPAIMEWNGGGLVWSSESATPEALIRPPSCVCKVVDKDLGPVDTVAALQLPLDKIFILTLSITRSCRASCKVQKGIILFSREVWIPAPARLAYLIQHNSPDLPPPIQLHLEPKTSYACMQAQSICWVQVPICTHPHRHSHDFVLGVQCSWGGPTSSRSHAPGWNLCTHLPPALQGMHCKHCKS